MKRPRRAKQPDVPVKTYNEQLEEHANNPELPDYIREFFRRILRARRADEARRREGEATAKALKTEEGLT